MFSPEVSAPASVYDRRRERVFLILAGLFLGSLTMLNILGITRFIKIGEMPAYGLTFAVAVGVLPYPVTFLCTDLISELFGRRRANLVVWIGLVLNLWVVFILWIGGALPGFEPINPETGLPARDAAGRLPVFFEVRQLAFGAVVASMAAYLTAQFIDVHIFHKIKAATGGKHLWLRNNVSTLTSQLIDTVCVILLTYFFTTGLDAVVRQDESIAPQLFTLITTGYVFKVVAALIDTLPIYIAVRYLRQYLGLESNSSQSGSLS